MRTGTFHLNRYGTKWVILENGQKPKIQVLTPEGLILRTPLYFSLFGNFATVAIIYKGIKYELFPENSEEGIIANLKEHLLKYHNH